MRVRFTEIGWEQYQHRIQTDRDMLAKVNEIIRDVRRSPFKGLGTPEPLKGELAGWWSRRITREHRLVYRVAGTGEDQRIEIASCRLRY